MMKGSSDVSSFYNKAGRRRDMSTSSSCSSANIFEITFKAGNKATVTLFPHFCLTG